MSINCLTCLTCRVSFGSADNQRKHYREDWHSYNLKRKISQLPPITAQQYNKLEEHHNNQLTESKDNKNSHYCQFCRKQFNNKNAFETHSKSKKHFNSVENKPLNQNKESVIKTEDKTKNEENEGLVDNDSDWESVDSDEHEDEEPIEPKDCLFCDHSSDSIEDNICHMSEKHSFFIPDVEYVKDLKSLMSYLGEKVGFGHYCLWCCDSGKHFRSRRAAQQHMRDRGHTKINHSDQYVLEYSDFYDYTSSYPDFDTNQTSDEEVVVPHLEDEDWQLTLPSGAVVGHRSLFRYYKQNLKPIDDNPLKTKSSAILDKVMLKYRALGWTGITGEAALQRAKDIKFVQRIQNKYALKMGIHNNILLQKHFRCQNPF